MEVNEKIQLFHIVSDKTLEQVFHKLHLKIFMNLAYQ